MVAVEKALRLTIAILMIVLSQVFIKLDIISNGTIPCTVGQWSEWSDWQQCSVTCGGGTTERTRDCEGGLCEHCDGGICQFGSGSIVEVTGCNPQSCPGNYGIHVDIILRR